MKEWIVVYFNNTTKEVCNITFKSISKREVVKEFHREINSNCRILNIIEL